MEPLPQSMRIARRMIREIEALNKIKFGDESWAIICKHIAGSDQLHLGELERAEARADRRRDIAQDTIKRKVEKKGAANE